MFHSRLSVTLLFSIILSIQPSFALDMFVRFEGGSVVTDGESQTQDRQNWVDISGFAMGVENVINVGSASSGGGAGKASFTGVTLTKRVDKASPALMLASATGAAYETVTIEFTTPASGGPPAVIHRVIMKLVYVESVSSSYNDGEDAIEETIVLKHGAHEVTTFSQNAQGAVSQSGQYQWSIVKNEASLDIN